MRAMSRFQGMTASISERNRSRRVTFPFVPQASPANVRCSAIDLCSRIRVSDACLTNIAHQTLLVQSFLSPEIESDIADAERLVLSCKAAHHKSQSRMLDAERARATMAASASEAAARVSHAGLAERVEPEAGAVDDARARRAAAPAPRESCKSERVLAESGLSRAEKELAGSQATSVHLAGQVTNVREQLVSAESAIRELFPAGIPDDATHALDKAELALRDARTAVSSAGVAARKAEERASRAAGKAEESAGALKAMASELTRVVERTLAA